MITGASGEEVWSWNHDPFGKGTPTGTFGYNLRYPGQYYDEETGLNSEPALGGGSVGVDGSMSGSFTIR